MKHKALFVLFGITVPAAIFVRIIQLTEMIDPRTGFFKSNFSSAEYVVVGAFIAVIMALVILGRISGSMKRPLPGRSVLLGTVSALMGLSSVYFLVEYVINSLKNSMFGTTEIIYAFMIALNAAFFLYYAFCLFTGMKVNGFATVSPLLFTAFRLCLVFFARRDLARISDNIFDVGMLCLFLLFWLFHGKIVSELDYRKASHWVYGVGLSATMFAMMCTFPRLYIELFNKKLSLHVTNVPHLLDFIGGVYIVVFLIVTLKSTVKNADANFSNDA